VVWLIGGGSFLLVLLIVAGLVDLAKTRHTIETPQLVLWTAVIVILPVAGLIAYLFWRISRAESMQDALHYGEDHGDRTDPESPIRY
jgi:membrane protein implicated in regulation of membrane protease activity